MSQPLVSMELADGVATLRLNRPEVRNAINLALVESLSQRLDEIEADASVRAVIVSGSGKGFCAGSDLKELAGRSGLEAARMELRHAEVFDRLARLTCPVIAAAHGFALGGGLFLLLYCDLRIAAEETRFGLPEATLGWIPPWGLSRLAAWVGPAMAQQLVLARDTFHARRAYELRLVDHVLPAESLESVARDIARRVGRLSRQTIQETRAFFAHYLGRDHHDWDEQSSAAFARCFESATARQAVADFLARRK